MYKDILIGMAIGVAVGMTVKCGKKGVEDVVDKTKDVVRKKLKDIAASI